MRTRLREILERHVRDLPPGRRLRQRLATDSIERFGDGRSLHVLDAGAGEGLLATALARRHSDWTIDAVDLSEDKLKLAKELGATHAFNASDPDLLEKVKQATRGGVDYAIEMAGSTRAFESAYRITRRGGTTVTAGLPPPTATWAMPSTNLVAEERTIKGSYIGTCVPSRDLPRYIELYQQGKLPVKRLMTGKLKLDQINEGFDLLHEGKAVRQVVTF